VAGESATLSWSSIIMSSVRSWEAIMKPVGRVAAASGGLEGSAVIKKPVSGLLVLEDEGC